MDRKNRNILTTGLLLSAAWIVTAQTTVTTPPAQEPGMEVTAHTDSLAPLPPSEGEILTAQAGELYKKVKFMQYEGELESKLYPAVLEASDMAAKALRKADNDSLRDRNRNILTDLNPTLLQGAVYYSGQNDNAQLPLFARAYIDVQEMEEMRGVDFRRDMRIFPTLVYNAAYGASKDGDVEKAKEYFQLYLDCGEDKLRENVFAYLGQACMQTGDYARGAEVLSEGARLYPTNMQMIMMAMQCCIDGGYTDRLQPLLDRALILSPDDERLQNVQAKVYEREGDFKKALDIYNQIADTRPNSLENTRSMAICLYNLGAEMYNRSIMESDEKVSARNRRQSKAYFTSAADRLEQVLATTPADLRLLTALTQTYASLGNREKFDDANTRVKALGGKGLAFNDMPVLLGEKSQNSKGEYEALKVPSYAEFAKPYIEERLGTWAQRGEFEKMDDYRRRMAGGEGVDAYNQLNQEAADAYIREYGKRLVLTDLRRSDYDIDNETYRIDTPYGPTVVRVPLKNKEAEGFKAAWETVQIRAPRFIIRDDKVAIAEITYVVNGKRYTFSADDAATYKVPDVYVDVNGILAAAQAAEGKNPGSGTGSHAMAGIWTESDVDRDIPVTNRKSDNLFALIIANENYSKASDVFGALHDGSTMREYCLKTLGIPESQTILVSNATGNQVRDALEQLHRRVRGAGSSAEVIFYYAGHGLPDDATKEAFMMPVDANPLTTATLIPMKEIYSKLGDMDAAAVSVFLDACFSGEGRDAVAINEARGVALKAKEVAPQGNMYVLSAASSQQTAMPYKEKHHGLFTYFLLKKLQESKGNATLKEISDYVIRKVTDTSNSDPSIGKEQNPTVTTSGRMSALWDKKNLKGK